MSADLVRCGVCLERFNEDERKPKFLQCYHTFCVHCLRRLQQKRKPEDGGGLEFLCPSCRKVTRVGKKGVAALQDNFYLLPLSAGDEVYLSDDEVIDIPASRPVQVWCSTCKTAAGLGCSAHDTCSIEDLREQMATAMAHAHDELESELDMRRPMLEELQAVQRGWESCSVRERLAQQVQAQSLALALASSELEALQQNCEHEDMSGVAEALQIARTVKARAQERHEADGKRADLLAALQSCRLQVQTLQAEAKPQELVLDLSGETAEERALAGLLYVLLEAGNAAAWEKATKPRRKPRSSSVQTRSNLLSTVALSTESLPVVRNPKSHHGKGPRCFMDITVSGQPRGRIVIELRPDIAPKMCANFVALCTGELGYGYRGSRIFKALANDHIIGGDFEHNDGSGGHSIFNNKGSFLADSSSLPDEKGAVRMRGLGTDTKSGGGMVGSQFHIWVGDRNFRNFSRTLVIGKVTEGLELCQFISRIKTRKNKSGTYIIVSDVVIQNCGKL
ncbi:uncharacterized protein [Periplaneta americana]|uniref:uncharacterized protein n=1 Tax=Periplaneta americana TaxID=6978 RepID=UPI0037E93E8A